MLFHAVHAVISSGKSTGSIDSMWERKAENCQEFGTSRTAAKPPPNRHQVYPTVCELVAVRRLMLMDHNVTMVGAEGLEPSTSCV